MSEQRLSVPEAELGEGGLKARRDMQAGLLRTVFALVTGAAAILTLRETVAGGPAIAAVLATLLGFGALLWSSRPRAPLRALGLSFFCAIVLLILDGALGLGGAAGSALSFSFVPGFLALLVLGPTWGWGVCGLMLLGLGWLAATTPLPSRHDQLRLIDEGVMALFAAGLAHALSRSFGVYEAAIAKGQAALIRFGEQRQAIATTVYERLDPACATLVDKLSEANASTLNEAAVKQDVRSLIASLSEAKALARRESGELIAPANPDQTIRGETMRVWLRLGALLIAFFVARNILAGAPFASTIFSLVACVLFHAWLGRPESHRHLEATALAIGLCATGPMIWLVHAYGAAPDAPPLVVLPGSVIFTALLSQGPASWAIVFLNVAVLAWVSFGKTLSLIQVRLLTDLGLTCLVIVVALRSVFDLRGRYAQALLAQGQAMAHALRQHRRLAGTLFHDVSNHLQALSFHLELGELSAELTHARSLSRRVQRLITLSKDFLLSPQTGAEPTLESVSVGDAVESLKEAVGPRLQLKQQRFAAETGLEQCVRAQPELLIDSVLGNLLSNAIKFSPQGSVISLSAECVDSRVCIVLDDAGPGLPSEVLRRLGQEGVMPSGVGSAGERGQGYGLQLAQEHLARMGGRLELGNRTGGGAHAVVRLARA